MSQSVGQHICQTDGWEDRQTDRKIDRQGDKKTQRQANRQADSVWCVQLLAEDLGW